MSVVVFIILVLFALILFSGVYVFVKACTRGKEIPWLDEIQVKKTGFGKYYDCIVSSDAWLKVNNAQDIYTISDDGLRLHAYWIPAENARGTVLLAHGYRSTFLVDFGLAFVFYHALGMNILVPHQRAHGKSEGRYITFGVKESDDMKCWIRYHNQNFGAYQMILSGMSMGASTVLFLADQHLPSNVRGVIADCGFTSPYAILDVVFRKTTHLPSRLSLWVTNLICRIVAEFSLKEKDSREVLKNAKLPILMIHGKADHFVPAYMSMQGYDVCNAEKELLLVEDAGHGVSFLKNKEAYTRYVIAFLEKYLEDFI